MGSLSQPESQVSSSLSIRKEKSLAMDAIKKKMQAMKVEKDNACDRSDVCEEASKVAKLRAEKAEDEVAELATKARQLETELDVTTEKLGIISLQLEEKEKALLAAEAEMNALNRRVQGLEEDLEKTEEKLVAANTKLDKAGTAADDSERAKKVFENKAVDDDKRIAGLEKELKEAREKAEAADATYEEVSKKLVQCEQDLEKAEERADVGETKILELEEELRVVANNLKSLEVAEEKANQREKSYKEQIKTLSAKLQKEVDRLEDELVAEQEKFKAVTEELEQTFAE